MTTSEAIRDDEVILGTFMVNDFPTVVLFDVGASRSFVYPKFCAQFVIPHSPLSSMLDIKVAVVSSILVKEKFDGSAIVISGHAFPLIPTPMGIKYFDVVLSMDRLSVNRAEILSFEKYVCFTLVEGGSMF